MMMMIVNNIPPFSILLFLQNWWHTCILLFNIHSNTIINPILLKDKDKKLRLTYKAKSSVQNPNWFTLGPMPQIPVLGCCYLQFSLGDS